MLSTAALLLVAGALDGQAPSPPPLRFEVATIKPNKDGAGRGGLDILPGGGLKMQGITLKSLIAFAYDVREEDVSGGAKWTASDAYDLLARPEHPTAEDLPTTVVAPGTTAWDRVRLRLQALLADRFQLAVHKTSREVTGFALVQAKGGAKLKPSAGTGNPGTMRSHGRIDGRNGTMKMLAGLLSNWMGRTVEDRTGLTGAYDYTLEYAQEGDEGARPGTGLAVTSVPSALQEQLGLKLEAAKTILVGIIIDHAGHPSAN
jgi:uncharacterized protein (TIGR03435 family)